MLISKVAFYVGEKGVIDDQEIFSVFDTKDLTNNGCGREDFSCDEHWIMEEVANMINVSEIENEEVYVIFSIEHRYVMNYGNYEFMDSLYSPEYGEIKILDQKNYKTEIND